jgi:hypothetical protein
LPQSNKYKKEIIMAVVAKTVLIFASEEDRDKVLFTVPWRAFIDIINDGGGNHPKNLGYPASVPQALPDDLGPQHMTVTRTWENKKNAQDYIDWMSSQFTAIGVVPVSFTVEDYTE